MGRPRKLTTSHHVYRGVTISLYLRGRGDWEASFTIPGCKRGKATGFDERQCRAAAETKIKDTLNRELHDARHSEEKARELLKASGVTVAEAARFYLSESSSRELTGTIVEVRDRWLKYIQGKKDRAHYHHHRSSLQRTSYLAERFGDRQISTITLAELTNLQDELEVTRAGRTARNIHDAQRAMFTFAKKRGYLAADRTSVAERLDRPSADPGKKSIFSPEEMQRLVDFAWGYAMPGAIPLVVVAFGSTRSEEISKQDPDKPLDHRICWQDIKWKEDYIDVREEVAKTREPRHAGLPSNLKAMLLPLLSSGPLYTHKRLDLAFATIARTAGVVWKFNGLRHSCITYDMLLSPNATMVANRSGNSVTMIERSYRNTRAKPEQAKEWFSILPRVGWGNLIRKG